MPAECYLPGCWGKMHQPLSCSQQTCGSGWEPGHWRASWCLSINICQKQISICLASYSVRSNFSKNQDPGLYPHSWLGSAWLSLSGFSLCSLPAGREAVSWSDLMRESQFCSGAEQGSGCVNMERCSYPTAPQTKWNGLSLSRMPCGCVSTSHPPDQHLSVMKLEFRILPVGLLCVFITQTWTWQKKGAHYWTVLKSYNIA